MGSGSVRGGGATKGGSRAAIAAWLRLARISLLPTIWADALAGLALARVGGAPRLSAWALTAAALSLLYAGAMILNDWRDRALDRAHRPDRPLPSGLVRPDLALAVAVLLLLVAVSIGAGLVPPVRFVLWAMVALALAYDLAPGHLGPFGPPVLGTLRGLSVLAAALAAGLEPRPGWLAVLPSVAYVWAVSDLARFEDAREGRSRGFVAFRISIACAAASALPLLCRVAHGWPSGPFLAAAFLFALAAPARALRRAFRLPHVSGNDLRPIVGSMLGGIPLLDAALAAASARPAEMFGCLAAFGLVALLVRRFPPT